MGRSPPFGGIENFFKRLRSASVGVKRVPLAHNAPLSTPLPLDTASNYPRKEQLKAVQMGGFFFCQKVNYQHENVQEVMNEDM
ncbi:hypothetical protein D7V82_22175 [bacterium 1xD8-6]|nr:hypothetical protein D7V72_22460 [bacterium D16-36]RKI61540.1 hypothetical protein D7V82_22175 [bacterium 1xD8-6]